MVRSSFLLVLMAGLAACKGSEDPIEVCDNGSDDDNDGFADCEDQDCWGECAESDCGDGLDNDLDQRIDCDDPDCVAECTLLCEDGDCVEDCSNGIDDDLDFMTDCNDSDCAAVCDADGDGFQGLGGLDCDDTRDDVNPTMVEVPYDGLDNDCDPTTLDDDLDQDGFIGSDDCDDLVAETYPGAPEVCGNGRVDDCDATGDPDPSVCFGERSLSTADAHLTSGNTDSWAGVALGVVGDVTGDGVDELLIGAYGEGMQAGAVYMMSPPLVGDVDLSTATTYIYGESEEDWAGAALAGLGNIAAGPAFDLAIGARYDDSAGDHAGAVYLVSASETGTVDLRDAHSKLLAQDFGDSLGASVATAGDATGDGVPDLITGAPLALGTDDYGAAYIVAGPLPGGYVHMADAHVRIEGERKDDQAGCAVAGGVDVDGDGIDDVAVGACLNDRGGQNAGAAFLFRGSPTPGVRSVASAEGGMQGDEEQAQAGSAIAFGDLDGDGGPDLIVGGPGAADGAGRVWVIQGEAPLLTPPFASVDGTAAGDALGSSVSAGDVDGDGQIDLMVGAPYNDDAGEDAGAAYVVFGPLAGPGLTADVVLHGAAPFGFAGSSVLGVSDLDGDGRDEMVVGAPFVDDGAPGSGAVYMLQWGW